MFDRASDQIVERREVVGGRRQRQTGPPRHRPVAYRLEPALAEQLRGGADQRIPPTFSFWSDRCCHAHPCCQSKWYCIANSAKRPWHDGPHARVEPPRRARSRRRHGPWRYLSICDRHAVAAPNFTCRTGGGDWHKRSIGADTSTRSGPPGSGGADDVHRLVRVGSARREDDQLGHRPPTRPDPGVAARDRTARLGR
ncbi:Uncharacterised protein [Mycobacterium tuberculosis]|uniref:Uncharacterized protein n=1 Tax=Mycobacterium tuberculosis TaxID=1773 RepID=A0A655ATR3_MYCTX|nr:Uncharacterised protein [Mycobacterium tuberculosis]CKT72483.1 Uncharacterised protein [Mycobacterium tuberculosis]CKT98260.1 Uncharacterised protein [Mycobacterium tuberculosis]